MKRFIPLLLLLLPALLCAPCRAADLPARFEAAWNAALPGDSKGYGVALVPEAGKNTSAATPDDWVEPNLPGALCVGFDTFNPPTKNPFNADGNIDNRPQREISLHLNGVEVANRFCSAELLGAEHQTRLSVVWVVGGAEVSVWVDKTPVYDRYFVPDAAPYKARFASGGAAKLTGLSAKFSGNFAARTAAPVRVSAFSHVLNDGGHHKNAATVVFPQHGQQVGRVICTLTLDKTPDGVDKWDRIAAVYIYDASGQRFEILRYMTPYSRAYQWKADVTDFLPLFSGVRKMEVVCETYGAGWEVSVDFDFHYGPIKHVPYKVVNLWTTTAVLDEADKPVEAALPPLKLVREVSAKQTKVRLCVTGHGQAPNTDNAAEFIQLWRKLHVSAANAPDKDAAVYENVLWKTDNYLNPCRPQGGTWKYDRAGWGPGDIVTPWVLDITSDLPKSGDAVLRYEIQPFVNQTPDHGNPARHIIEAQVIYYK